MRTLQLAQTLAPGSSCLHFVRLSDLRFSPSSPIAMFRRPVAKLLAVLPNAQTSWLANPSRLQQKEQVDPGDGVEAVSGGQHEGHSGHQRTQLRPWAEVEGTPEDDS